MKVKQHTLLSFEFTLDSEEDKESLSSYLDKNRELLKNHLLVFKEELPEDVKEALQEQSICFLNRDNCSLNMRKKRVVPFEVDIDSIIEEKKSSDSEDIPVNAFGTLLTSEFRGTLHRPIRSGELIETDKDIVVLSRMNSGSEISSNGNVEIFGVIDGKIECNGAYMILSRIGEKGSVIFNGIILDKALFKTKQPKIVKLSTEGKVKIEELV